MNDFSINAQSINMKMIKLKSSLLVGLCLISMLFAGWTKSSLKDITKPYLGEYECKTATMDGKDCLKQFDYIRLEIKPDGTFTLNFCKKNKGKDVLKGSYQYESETSSILFKIGKKKGIQRRFPLKNGILYIIVPFGGKTLSMTFRQK